MNPEGNRPSVYGTMRVILNYLNSPQEKKNLSANLAAIRNSTGKRDEYAAGVWPILIPFMPSEFLGRGTLTYEEKALLTTVQLYAVGQQGSDKILNDESGSMGKSLRGIRIMETNTTALDRRFNAMLTSTTFDEFAYHLRQLVKLGKSKSGFSVNFPGLAQDLFLYQIGKNKQICLKWAVDYYRTNFKETNHQSEK